MSTADDVRGRAIIHSMWTELEKIAKYRIEGVQTASCPPLLKAAEDSAGERVLKAAPAAGAIVGGTAGFSNPDLFNPQAFLSRASKKSVKGRAISGIFGAGAGATTMGLPLVAHEAYKSVVGKKKQAEAIEGPDGSPVAKILGASIEKLDERKAHGVPIVEPPPGFVYEPELQSFVPDSSDPGWLTEPEALQARENQQSYQQGQSDTQQATAQNEADSAAQQTLALQQQQMDPNAAQQAQPQVDPNAAQQAQPAPAPPQPGQITGLHPMAQAEGSKGVAKPKVKQPGPKSATSIAR